MTHEERNCPAFGKKCFICDKMSQFARKCRSVKNKESKVHLTIEEPEEESYYISSFFDSAEPTVRKAVINMQISKPENTDATK